MRQHYHFAKGLNESSPVGPKFTIKVKGYYAKSKMILRNASAVFAVAVCLSVRSYQAGKPIVSK